MDTIPVMDTPLSELLSQLDSDLTEVCTAAESYAGALRAKAQETRSFYGALPLAEGAIAALNGQADLIDAAVARMRAFQSR